MPRSIARLFLLLYLGQSHTEHFQRSLDAQQLVRRHLHLCGDRFHSAIRIRETNLNAGAAENYLGIQR